MESRKPYLATLPGLILGCLVCCALWGSAFPCIKIGYGLFMALIGLIIATVVNMFLKSSGFEYILAEKCFGSVNSPYLKKQSPQR